MKHIHQQEKEQFKTLFKQEHIDNIDDRFAVLEVFLQTESHVSVDMLHDLLKQKGYDFSTGFLRDTLKLLCRYGFAQKNKFDNGVVRYEHRHLGQHHDHMICTKCRKISSSKTTIWKGFRKEFLQSMVFTCFNIKWRFMEFAANA
jgi:Fur family transcriptional regulator, ferric uptake regulator